MDFPANQWAVILGGSSGFGLATAFKLARHGLNLHAGRVLLRAKHAILANRLVIDVVEAAPVAACPRRAALRWVALDRVGEVAISGATKKIARAVLAQRRSKELLTSASSGSRGRVNA